ncbi:MAG: HTH-type transcriptional regulator CymR [Lentisphaerae bacterium ADurb.Bin242]|nr:MAG: HTH-type transcriptional regulator CymR [Lentisphaerae bacterium ADurb.Bin242]
MKISTKGRYGLRILLDLARHENGNPRLIRDIAESQQISEKYISRLIIDLRRAGMVRSIRGAKGGFRIAKSPRELTLLDIVEVMEGPLSIVDCVRAPERCPRNLHCVTREIWDNLNADIRESMRKVTLQDIIENDRKQHIAEGILDYCI